MLLVILTVVALVAWLGTMVVEKRLSFRAGWLNLLPGLFLVSVLVSSIFSLAGYQTWVGQASQEYVSFLSTVMFVILFYVFMNVASGTDVQRNLITALLLSATLSGILAVLGALNLFHLPFDFAASSGFNTVGTMNGMSTFLSVVMFMGLALWLVSNGKDRLLPEGKIEHSCVS